MHLPDRSGLDVTSLIRSRKAIASTPVVHISAVAVETTDRVAGLDVGADAYLVDPIDPEEMLSTVRALLRASGARRSAERQAARSGRLHRASVRLNVAANPARLADAAARAASEVLDTVAVAAVVGDDGQGFRSTASSREVASGPLALDAAELATLLADVDDTTVARLGGDVWRGILPVVGEGDWRLWIVRESAAVAGFVAVPAESVGADKQSASLMQRLAQSVSVALGNLRALAHERRTALMLQRSLLPADLPEPTGLVIAARYRASEQHAEVGGDFFDAFETDDGRCFVVIGDIQGHSLEAAVVMAEIRYSLRAYAFDGHAPTDILDRLDALLGRRGNPRADRDRVHRGHRRRPQQHGRRQRRTPAAAPGEGRSPGVRRLRGPAARPAARRRGRHDGGPARRGPPRAHDRRARRASRRVAGHDHGPVGRRRRQGREGGRGARWPTRSSTGGGTARTTSPC